MSLLTHACFLHISSMYGKKKKKEKRLGLITDTLYVLSPDFQVVRNTMYGNVKKDTFLYHS